MIEPPAPADPRRRLPLVVLAGVALVAGLLGPLVLLQVPLPEATFRLAGSHGALMTLGFLGTLVSLERAAALGRRWGWLAPLASGIGGICLVVGLPSAIAYALFSLGGVMLLAIYVAFDRIERSLHGWFQAVGALGWLVGALLLLLGRPIAAAVPWLGAFVLLTIAGERLELARIGRAAGQERPRLLVALALFCAGVALTLLLPDPGFRLTGLGLLLLSGWFARYDLARHTIRRQGVTRFIAACLLPGYAWLAVAGVGWLIAGEVYSGPAYDATIHALFLGFAISMVFGHAPIILPAVLGVPLPYHPVFYGHLVLLHVGLVLRIGGGDLLGWAEAWRIGGIINVTAMLLFVVASATAAVIALVRRPRSEQRPTGAGTG